MAHPDWETIVIGGGLAGGAAAAQLARAGRRVLLLEKERAVHHKVCGEFISIEAQAYLQQLQINLPALGAVPIDRLTLAGGASHLSQPLPFTAYSLSRKILDAAILERAAQCGAMIEQGQAVRSLQRNGEHWLVETSLQQFSAETVLLACGKHDLRGWPRPADTQSDLIGFKMYFRLADPAALAQQVQLFLFPQGYAGLEPVEDDLANLCLVVRKQAFAKAGKDWERLLQMLLAQTPVLAAVLQGAVPQWPKPLAIFGIPYGFVFKDHGGDPGLYRLGDQMAVIPSLCGDGMAIALHTGITAAAAILAGESSHAYHQRLRVQLRPQIRTAMRLSWLALWPPIQCLLPRLLRFMPWLLPRLIFATRVNDPVVP